MVPSDFIAKYNKPYPGREAGVPQTLDLQELFPAALFTRGLYPLGIEEPEKFGIPYQAEAMIHGRTNLMMNSHDPEAMAETLEEIKFQVSISMFIDETSEFADIILPDAHDFERWDMFPANDPYAFIAPGPGKWYFLARQPVVEPPGDARPWTEIYLELAKRLGILEEMYQLGNECGTSGKNISWIRKRPTRCAILPSGRPKPSSVPISDLEILRRHPARVARKNHAGSLPADVSAFAGFPFTWNIFWITKKMCRTVLDELGLEWDLSAYTPVPIWIPCEANEH